VDQEALESVLNAPDRRRLRMAFVRLVNAEWAPKVLDEKKFEPLEVCMLEDVGWMKVPFGEVVFTGVVLMRDANHWDRYYFRPPQVQWRSW
jgi:hypothetical protein